MDTVPEEKLPTDSWFIKITNTTKHFLQAAFSGTMDNNGRTACINRIGAPNCEQIRYPKLDEVLKAILSTFAKKKDGYLS